MSHLPDTVSSPGPSKPTYEAEKQGTELRPQLCQTLGDGLPSVLRGRNQWAGRGESPGRLQPEHVRGHGPSRARSAVPLRIESSNELGYLFSFFMSR